MSIDYICIRSDVLTRTDLTDKEKILLGLITGLSPNPLMLSNAQLAALLAVKPETVSKIIHRLFIRRQIAIEHPHSRYRKITLARTTADSHPSTVDVHPTTVDEKPTINKETKENGLSIVQAMEHPTQEQVQMEITQQKYQVDAYLFCQYYRASNWKDRRGNPIANWKQTLLGWHRRQVSSPSQYRAAPASGRIYHPEPLHDHCTIIDV